MATVNPDQQNAIVNLYVAVFNRAPDANGFEFWTQALASGASLSSITGSFFVSPEAAASYPASQSAGEFVAAFYQTVFGRTADADGLAFWTAVLTNAGGVESEAAKALLVSKIIDLVSTSLDTKPNDLSDAQYAETVSDRSIFAKKHLAATDFAVVQKGTDLGAAKQALLDAITPAPTPIPVGQIYALTTDIDTFTGNAGNDTFNAPLQDFSNTLSDEDTLDGGAGTDTLNVTLLASSVVTPKLKNIEIVNLSVNSVQGGLDVGGLTGLTHAGFVESAASGTLVNVGKAALSVSNQVADASFSGSTATTLSLTLTNVGTFDYSKPDTKIDLAKDGAAAQATTHDIVLTDSRVSIIESVASAAVVNMNFTATGENYLNLSTLDATTVEKITVTGTGSVNIGNFLTSITDFTGSGGGYWVTTDTTTPDSLSIDTGAGTGRDVVTANGPSIKLMNLGGGNDDLRVNGALSTTAVVKLGAGDDNLTLLQGSVAGATVDAGDGDDAIFIGPITHAVAGVREVATMTESTGVAANQSFSVGGLTFTAGNAGVTSAQLLEAFANLANGATAGTSVLGSYSGKLSGYSTGASANGAVTFTATSTGDISDLESGGTSSNAASIVVTTQGVTAVAGSADTLTGGAGADTYLFYTPIVDTTAGQVTVTITDFVTGVDKLNIVSDRGNFAGSANSVIRAGESASLEALLVDATAKLVDKVYYVGQVGEDTYLVTGYASNAYTHVIKLTGITPNEFADADLIGQQSFSLG